MAAFDPMVHSVNAKYSLTQLHGEFRFMRISVLLYSGDLEDADNLHLKYHCNLEVEDDDIARWAHDGTSTRVYEALQAPIVDSHLRKQDVDPLVIDLLLDYLRTTFGQVAGEIINLRKQIYPLGSELSREIIVALNQALSAHNAVVYEAPQDAILSS